MTFKLADFLRRNDPPRSPPDPPPKDLCPRTNKIRYALRGDADQHMAALRKTDPQGERLRKYRCWSCGDWHVGHID